MKRKLLTIFILAMVLTGCQRVVQPLPDTQGITMAPLEPSAETQALIQSQTGTMVCEIKGYVARPGVYEMKAGDRVADLVRLAGDVLPQGSLAFVNQAKRLQDGEVVVVPKQGTDQESLAKLQLPLPAQAGAAPSETSQPDQIDLNQADAKSLEEVPGIGPATAKNIIDYRTAHGPFKSLEELKEVDRIGDKTFEKLKGYFTIGPP